MSENKLPSTIRHPESFLKHLPAGFDGVFEWSWTKGCFGNPKIEPKDFDGVVERNGNFLIFESKEPGMVVSGGQLYTLESIWRRGGVTLLYVYGKTEFKNAVGILPKKKDRSEQINYKLPTVESAREFIKKWYVYADRNKFIPRIL